MFDEPVSLDRKIIDVTQGLSKTFSRKIYNQSGRVITGFTGDERLSVEMWVGDVGGVISDGEDVSAQWARASEGEYTIRFPEMSIQKGIYWIRVLLDPHTSTCYDSKREIYRGMVKIDPSPTDTIGDPLKSYCTYADLLLKAPWLETTHTDNDLSGFSRQRHRARMWVDSVIINNAPGMNWNASNVVFYGVFPPGYSMRNQIASMLKSDHLIITDSIREASAHYSLFLICDALSSSPTTGSYGEIAAKHYSRATSLLNSSLAEFDTGSGKSSHVVDLRKVDGRSAW